MLGREHDWAMTSKRFTSILVALDGSDGCWCALDAALALCREAGAQLTVLALEARVSARFNVILGIRNARRACDGRAIVALEEASVFASYADVHVVARRSIPSSWRAIAACAIEHRQDLIVLGHRPGLVRGRLLPSTAERIASQVHCPVMIVHPGQQSIPVSGAVV